MRTRVAGAAAIGIAFIALALSGCADGARLSSLPTITPYYYPTLVWHATRDGGMRTVIYGNPFDRSQIESNKLILAALKLPTRFEASPFQLLAPDAPRRGYRLVLVFNPNPIWIGFQDACGDLSDINVAAASDAIALHASFCIGTRAITELDLIGVGRGPDDPAFVQLMRSALDELLPAHGVGKQFGPPGI